MTRLGDIWKFVATKFLAKEASYYLQRFGLFWKPSLLCINCIDYFWGNFWKKLGHFLLQHRSHWLLLTSNGQLLYNSWHLNLSTTFLCLFSIFSFSLLFIIFVERIYLPVGNSGLLQSLQFLWEVYKKEKYLHYKVRKHKFWVWSKDL